MQIQHKQQRQTLWDNELKKNTSNRRNWISKNNAQQHIFPSIKPETLYPTRSGTRISHHLSTLQYIRWRHDYKYQSNTKQIRNSSILQIIRRRPSHIHSLQNVKTTLTTLHNWSDIYNLKINATKSAIMCFWNHRYSTRWAC